MTYQEALHYFDSFINYEKKDDYDYRLSFKLDRMRDLCFLLGEPQKDIKSIHVAGSKGKGSTAALIHSILINAGLKVGLYTSPHLHSFRERIRVGDGLISEDDVGEILETVKSAVDKMAGNMPSFFEVYTALAFLYFKKKKVDFAVYEVGLGGRLDATNVIEPLVSVITPISYDHMNILGDTIQKIAYEKAGIIKQNGVCVSAPQDKDALAIIEGMCEEKNALLMLIGRDILCRELEASDEEEVFTVSGFFGEYKNLRMKMLGAHQVINAATAIGAVEALRVSGVSVSAEAIKKGIRSARWPGRLEMVQKRSPRIILDGAQNRASADVLARAVKRLFKYKKLILVLGISKDKDIKGILKELVPIADSIVLTKSKIVDRAMDPAGIYEMITPKTKDIAVTQNVKNALEIALSKAKPSDLVLVTGSLFVVGEARHILVKDK